MAPTATDLNEARRLIDEAQDGLMDFEAVVVCEIARRDRDRMLPALQAAARASRSTLLFRYRTGHFPLTDVTYAILAADIEPEDSDLDDAIDRYAKSSLAAAR